MKNRHNRRCYQNDPPVTERTGQVELTGEQRAWLDGFGGPRLHSPVPPPPPPPPPPFSARGTMDDLAAAVTGVIGSAPFMIEEFPFTTEEIRRSFAGRIWAAITGAPTTERARRPGVIRLVVLDVSTSVSGPVVREAIDIVRPAGVRVVVDVVRWGVR